MTLYKTIYWTKRAAVVLSVILVLCGSFRIFLTIAEKLTQKEISISDLPPENGFGPLDRLTIKGLEIPVGFEPEITLDTLRGRYEALNGYPLEDTINTQANVYKIQTNSINVSTSGIPLRIARSLGFAGDPQNSTSTSYTWTEANRVLNTDGLYFSVDYSNRVLFSALQTSESTLISNISGESGRSIFEKVFRDLGITGEQGTNIDEYTYQIEEVSYNPVKKVFEPEPKGLGTFYRISAKRNYTSLLKGLSDVTAIAAYPDYYTSNNYIIIPKKVNSNAKVQDYLVEFKFYNWFINQSTDVNNEFVQTYEILKVTDAFAAIDTGDSYLVAVKDLQTGKSADISTLAEIPRIDIRQITVAYFEDLVNKFYIQPIYVFVGQGRLNNRSYEFVYYVPAIIYLSN